MERISSFTLVSYMRPHSCFEGVLSTLSRYFYLGGNQAKVIRKDEVQLEPGRISSRTIALKVAAYVLLFPLTLALLVINLGLRSQRSFTVISPKVSTHKSSKGPFLARISHTISRDGVPDCTDSPRECEKCGLDGHQKPIDVSPAHSITETTSRSSDVSQGDGEIGSILLKEFGKKIKSFSSYDKHPEQIAGELFKNIPKNLKFNELVNFIFNECELYEIPSFLEAILIAHPSFTLSPYDNIRRKIMEDEGHALNNSSLIALFKEHSLDGDEEKLAACYDLAYRLNHPYIYSLSRTPILPSDYSLNFLWVNLNPQNRVTDTAQSIFGDGLDPSENADCIKSPQALHAFEENKDSLKDWEKIKKSFVYRISKWADVNPGAQINLWYDSALVTRKAQQKTFEMMRSISESRGANLKLRDIRQLSNISGEIKNSLHPGTQVFYRVDILKAVIADHMISSEESPKYCVVSDIDVQPMSPQQIFDQRTVDYLSSDGYVFNRVRLLGNFENSFFIFNKKKEGLREIHNETVIKETAFNITELRRYPVDTRLRPNYTLDAQFVFKQYSQFRQEMKEKKDRAPRKVVKCPESQFNFGGYCSKSDYQAEEFRFIGDSDVPYTRNGRNVKDYSERQIEELINWQAVPLPLV